MASVDWVQEVASLYFTFTPDDFENLITDRKDPLGNGSAITYFVGKAAKRGTALFLYTKLVDKQVTNVLFASSLRGICFECDIWRSSTSEMVALPPSVR